MILNCIIVEDQPPAQRILKKFIEDVGNLQLMAVFSNGVDAIEFLNSHSVQLMFLDIHLPKINGIDFLKSLTNPPQVILTTAFSDYALEGYDLNVVDYLLKPFSFQRFLQAVNKVVERQQGVQPLPKSPSQNDSVSEIYVKSGHEFIKVNLHDIIFINSDSDYTEIQMPQRKVLSNEPLKHWLEVLPDGSFMQLHKSYIINTSKIDRISGNQVFMVGGNIIPVGRAFKDHFMQRLLKN